MVDFSIGLEDVGVKGVKSVSGVGISKICYGISGDSCSSWRISGTGAKCLFDTEVSLPSGKRIKKYAALDSISSFFSTIGSYWLVRGCFFNSIFPGCSQIGGDDPLNNHREWLNILLWGVTFVDGHTHWCELTLWRDWVNTVSHWTIRKFEIFSYMVCQSFLFILSTCPLQSGLYGVEELEAIHKSLWKPFK